MVPVQLLLGDEVDNGVVLVKVVGHGLDVVFDLSLVCPFLGHHKALPQVLLAGGELRLAAAAHRVHGGLNGDGVLLGVGHPFHPADGVGMALADPLAPEGVVRALGQDGPGIQPVEGEQARVPAAGDHRHLAAGLGAVVHGGEVLGNAGVGVKAVNHMEVPGILRGLHRQVGGAAAAEDEHIHLVLVLQRLAGGVDRNPFGQDGDGFRVPAGEYRGQNHVRVLTNGALDPPAQVAVAHDTNSNLHVFFLLGRKIDDETVYHKTA